jgi:hypothetical protein
MKMNMRPTHRDIRGIRNKERQDRLCMKQQPGSAAVRLIV